MNTILGTSCIENFKVPIWLKIFSYLFMFLGGFIPVVVIFSLIGHDVMLGIYGLSSNTVLNFQGIIIILLFAIKAIVGFGILRKKKWAFKLAIFDAIIGIVICSLNFSPIDSATNNLNGDSQKSLELIILVFYLIYLFRNRLKWKTQFINKL